MQSTPSARNNLYPLSNTSGAPVDLPGDLNDLGISQSPVLFQMRWRSVLSGITLSFLFFGAAMSLGVGIGGVALQNANDSAQVGLLAAGWSVASLIVGLFFGSYLSSRVTLYRNLASMTVHGLTVAAVFFAIILSGAGGVTSSIGRNIGLSLADLTAQDASRAGICLFIAILSGSIFSVLGSWTGFKGMIKRSETL